MLNGSIIEHTVVDILLSFSFCPGMPRKIGETAKEFDSSCSYAPRFEVEEVKCLEGAEVFL